MSLPRLCLRVARLEHDARRVVWFADMRVSCVRLMAEAGAAVGLAPAGVQELCTALDQTLYALSQDVPACITDPQALDTFASRVLAAVVTMLDTQVTDPSTRDRLRTTLSQACRREAMARGGYRTA